MSDPPDHLNTGPPVDVLPEEVKSDNYVLNELKRLGLGWQDVFDKQVAKGTSTDLEIAAHYEYNPERWRVFVDGARQFIEYGSIPQYNHSGSDHQLRPGAGETVVMETTERPRYTVQYELAATWAASINQDLQSGDRVRIGFYDGTDGWFIEHNDTHEALEADFCVSVGGSIVQRTTRTIARPFTDFTRFLLRTGWYRVTRQLWKQSYADEGAQENPEIARTGDVGTEGPEVGNLPLRFEVTAGSGTTGLELAAGSCALVTYGDISTKVREKTHSFQYTFTQTDTWVPVHALRVDPGRGITSVQIENTNVVSYGSTSGNVRVMPMAVSPLKTDAGETSGWTTPIEHSERNSVVEIAGTRTSPDVSTFPDTTGGVVSSASNPGGYQLGYGSWYSSGTGSKTNVSSGAVTRKREISSRDVCVFVANATVAESMTVEVITEQDY